MPFLPKEPRPAVPLPIGPKSVCQGQDCGHPFEGHFGSGLRLAASGPCKTRLCPCRKFVPRQPEALLRQAFAVGGTKEGHAP